MNYSTPYHPKDISESRFLITGGAGFIGSNLVEYLLEHGAGKVRVLDNLSTGFVENLNPFRSNPRFEFLQGDIRSLEDCKRACDGITHISHQAALGSVPRSLKEPAATNEVNVGGFVNMLTAARDAGIQRVVYASSSSVYGDEPTLPKVEARVGEPLSPYAVSKKANELYGQIFARAYGMTIIGLRYFNIFGPRQDPKGAYAAVIPLFIHKMLTGERPVIDGDGMQSRDFTYVENAVQANIRALTAPLPESYHEIFNIAVGERFTVNDLFASIALLIESGLEPQYGPPRQGDVRNSLADISKANEVLGYAPTVDFQEGLKRTLHYFREYYLK